MHLLGSPCTGPSQPATLLSLQPAACSGLIKTDRVLSFIFVHAIYMLNYERTRGETVVVESDVLRGSDCGEPEQKGPRWCFGASEKGRVSRVSRHLLRVSCVGVGALGTLSGTRHTPSRVPRIHIAHVCNMQLFMFRAYRMCMCIVYRPHYIRV